MAGTPRLLIAGRPALPTDLHARSCGSYPGPVVPTPVLEYLPAEHARWPIREAIVRAAPDQPPSIVPFHPYPWWGWGAFILPAVVWRVLASGVEQPADINDTDASVRGLSPASVGAVER